MIETPRAALRADEIAEEADFFTFGTNDLTQMTFGFSRDDVEGRMMPAYLEQGLLQAQPVRDDRPGRRRRARARSAPQRGRATKPDLKLGVCGEHGGDPESIALLLRRRPRLRVAARRSGCRSPGWRRPRPSSARSATPAEPGSTPRCSPCRARGRAASRTSPTSTSRSGCGSLLLALIIVLLLVDLLVVHRERPRHQHQGGGHRVGRAGSRSASRSACVMLGWSTAARPPASTTPAT